MYCTYLTCYSGNKLPPFYIGYSTVLKVENGYRGTVTSKAYQRIWKSELKNNSHLFKIKILSIHETKGEAKAHETYTQKFFQVHKNPMYINLAICGTEFFNKGGHIVSVETREKISRGNKGKIVTEEHRNKISKANKGKPGTRMKTLDERKNHSEKLKGKKRKPFTEEHKRNISLSHMGIKRSERNSKIILDIICKPVEFRGIRYNSISEAARFYMIETGYKIRWATTKIQRDPSYKIL